MNNKTYYITKDKKKKTAMFLELDKIDGYQVNPKTHKDNSIKVDKIVFVNNDLSEKIIRRKVDSKIAYLLKQLKQIEEDDGTDNGMISKSLMDAEKLRIQLLTKYVKYLGNTYQSLSLKKIQIIIEELKYKIYMNRVYNQPRIYPPFIPPFYEEEQEEVKESKRGR